MIGGKSQAEQVQEERQNERKHRLDEANIQQAASRDEDGDAAQILRILSDIDDLPIDPGDNPILGQLVSRLTSTANLTPEQVESNEWVREYIVLLYLCKHPPKTGLHGAWRGWAHGDASEERDPLSPERRMTFESFIQSSKLALTRSEDAKVMEESTRTVNESVVHERNQSGGGGGILGRLRS